MQRRAHAAAREHAGADLDCFLAGALAIIKRASRFHRTTGLGPVLLRDLEARVEMDAVDKYRRHDPMRGSAKWAQVVALDELVCDLPLGFLDGLWETDVKTFVR
jgi:hypothetical protein